METEMDIVALNSQREKHTDKKYMCSSRHLKLLFELASCPIKGLLQHHHRLDAICGSKQAVSEHQTTGNH